MKNSPLLEFSKVITAPLLEFGGDVNRHHMTIDYQETSIWNCETVFESYLLEYSKIDKFTFRGNICIQHIKKIEGGGSDAPFHPHIFFYFSLFSGKYRTFLFAR